MAQVQLRSPPKARAKECRTVPPRAHPQQSSRAAQISMLRMNQTSTGSMESSRRSKPVRLVPKAVPAKDALAEVAIEIVVGVEEDAARAAVREVTVGDTAVADVEDGNNRQPSSSCQ